MTGGPVVIIKQTNNMIITINVYFPSLRAVFTCMKVLRDYELCFRILQY